MRVLIEKDPFIEENAGKAWQEQGLWPASWILCADAGHAPFVAAYRRKFYIDAAARIRIHVSADERYELFLDGVRLGRGPERGAPDTWFYESFDLDLQAGEHVLTARAWALGELAPDAQMSSAPGFLLAAEGEWNAHLSTGVAAWEAKLVGGIDYHRQTGSQLRGSRFSVDGSLYPWGHESGLGEGWKPVVALKRAMGRWINWDFYKDHRLQPAMLPEMHEASLPPGNVRHVQDLVAGINERRNAPVQAAENLTNEVADWQALLDGSGTVKVSAVSGRRVILELADYSIAYPELTISGGKGGLVEVQWAEALKLTPDVWDPHKGNRNEIEGKYFAGLGDRFLPDGGDKHHFEPLWWMAGRYVEVYVQSGDEPIVIEGIKFTERRYPLEMGSQFTCSDARLTDIIPIMLRGMQMCSNETFFDCPYYEELMYTGDTRLECLVTYILTNDDRLPRKALRMFDVSRLASGMTQSRYPCRSTQVISTFALWWIGLAHDYLFWRSDAGYIRSLLPGMRATIQGFQRLIGEDGLLSGSEGWNTIDWVPEWSDDAGVPPEGHTGISGLLNWQYIYALRLYEDLERRLGDAEQADWAERIGRELAEKATAAFWNPERGLLADNLTQTRFSEHTQLLAILIGRLEAGMAAQIEVNLFADANLDRATIYFSHYYFEVCRLLDRMDKFFERMDLWFYLKEMGFKTPVESPEPSRSDCHAWSSHPLFHYHATLLGIRPAEPEFRRVEIAPHLGSLDWARGQIPHPDGGMIDVELRKIESGWEVKIELPTGLLGTFRMLGKVVPLNEGRNKFKLF